MRKQLLVDMDGVLADVYQQFIKLEFEDLGITQEIESLNGKSEPEAFKNYEKYVKTQGFFREAPVIRGSIEGLKYLNKKYDVLIVSSATEFPYSLKEKHDWLNEHFPFISWKQIIFCGTKSSIRGDVMIDDHPKNLDYFKGQSILFTQPHNTDILNNKYIRVESWSELISIL